MQLYEKERLVFESKFPDHRQLREPYSGTDAERISRIAAFQEFAAHVKALSPKDLDERCIEIFRRQKIEQEEAARRFDQMAYFNQPEAEADFNFWSKSKTWTIDEATALLLGKDPLKVRWDDLYQLRVDSIFVENYQNLRMQLLRAQRDDRFIDGDEPLKFTNWALATGRDLPPGLSLQAESTKKTASNLSTKEHNSMLTIMIAMAKQSYDYDAKARNQAARRIAEYATDIGLPISDDTVRGHLQEAAHFFDENRIEK